MSRFSALFVAIAALLAFATAASGSEAVAAKRARADLVVVRAPAVASVLARGSRVRVKDMVKNRGRAKARRSTTRYYLSLDKKRSKGDNRLKGKRTVKALKAKKRSRGRARVTIPATVAIGRYRLLACADDRKKVKEARERNNCRASRVVSIGQAGLDRTGPDPTPDGGAHPLPDTQSDPAPNDSDGDGAPDTADNCPAVANSDQANADGDTDGNACDSDDDNDGSADDTDCNPLDPTAHPGAADTPEGSYADTNCDGVDGAVPQAIFVSTVGSDTSPGTQDQPKRTANAGVQAALAAGKHEVYVARGTYDETLLIRDGVSVYGGYETDWKRSAAGVTRFAGGPGGIAGGLADGIASKTVIAQLTFAPQSPTIPGTSSYGLKITNSRGLVIDRVVAIGAPGVPGNSGATGPSARPGSKGGAGTNICGRQVGAPGASPVGRVGGVGGRSGYDCAGDDGPGYPGGWGTVAGAGGGQGGAGGTTRATAGQPGAPGAHGSDGSGGAFGNAALTFWVGRGGLNGQRGGHGHGGGGGGGAESGDGGGGGGGGEGGAGGQGGGAGGSSFGIYIYGSPDITLTDSTVTASDAGSGGHGTRGRLGGTGGDGGGIEGGDGATGGPGGSGGAGGDGGGGAGGVSYALFTLESTVSEEGNSFSFGAPGSGGAGGDTSNANKGADGKAGIRNTPPVEKPGDDTIEE